MKHVLIEVQPPHRELRKCTDTICMHLVGHDGVPTQLVCDDFHPQGRLFRNISLKGGERAIILSIRLLYCSNNTGRDVHLQIQNLFDPSSSYSSSSSSLHPEKTGVAQVILPARHRGEVPKKRQLIYEPNLVNLGINVLHYAGLEDSIECARSSAVYPEQHSEGTNFISSDSKSREFELFKMSDPLIVFALQHRNHFPEITAQDIVQFKDSYYKMRLSAVDRVRAFFKNAVFPLFHYTRPDHAITLVWNPDLQPPPVLPPHLLKKEEEEEEAASGFAMIVFTLEMEYVIVSPHHSGFTLQERALF